MQRVAERIGYTLTPSLIRAENVGVEIEIPDLPDDELRELVKRELLPHIDPRVHKRRIAPDSLADGSPVDEYCALLRDLDHFAFAAIYRPASGLYECLYLPETIGNLAPWLLFAFKRWAKDLPEVFPVQPEWTTQPTWMTQREELAAKDLDAKRAEMQAIVAAQQAGHRSGGRSAEGSAGIK